MFLAYLAAGVEQAIDSTSCDDSYLLTNSYLLKLGSLNPRYNLIYLKTPT